MVFHLILENSAGGQIDITATANQYMTSKVEGLSPPPCTISTSSYAGMDGSYLNNAFIEKRNVVIHFEMRGVGIEARRQQLYKVVKPSRYIKIYYKTAGIDVFTEGYVETCEVNNFEMFTTGQISILCPDIYWYANETQTAEYSQVLGAFHFICPDNDKPFPIGQYNTENMMTIVNDGDNTGMTLVISGGPARRIIYPTLSFTAQTTYADIVRTAVTQNAIDAAERKIPGLSLGSVSGACWAQTATLQVSYDNLMEWIYTICEKIGGTANVRLVKSVDEKYLMVFELSEGIDRSMMQAANPHIIFSDAYSNLLSFSYAEDASIQRNFAYILGHGEGAERKQTTYCDGDAPTYLDRYEIYVDAKDISEEQDVDGETVPIPEPEYIELLKTRGSENIVSPKMSPSQILCKPPK